MKNKKDSSFKRSIGEAIAEIIFICFFGGIGCLIAWLLGFDLSSDNIDYELIVILGLATFFIVSALIIALVNWIKKKKK